MGGFTTSTPGGGVNVNRDASIFPLRFSLENAIRVVVPAASVIFASAIAASLFRTVRPSTPSPASFFGTSFSCHVSDVSFSRLASKSRSRLPSPDRNVSGVDAWNASPSGALMTWFMSGW